MRTSMMPKNQRQDVRKTEGERRNAAWAALSNAEKLASLDRRLGKGIGAKRQREKLHGAK